MAEKDDALVLQKNVELVREAGVPNMLAQIRPAWKNRNLIDRVQRLLRVDPSSACQRILNAAIHDLREKVVVAGLDIAKEAARGNKLPPVERTEDVEEYSTANLIDLAYYMGLLSRQGWRQLQRAYEIRRDLEHEDDEYEAGLADCVYVFVTSIEVVLARDPISVLRVTDVKQLIEVSTPAAPGETLLHDYCGAPAVRQEEIFGLLISYSLDSTKPEVVRENAVALLRTLSPKTHNQAKLKVAQRFQERLARTPLDHQHARVAQAAGLFDYLTKAQRTDYFRGYYQDMLKTGHHWKKHASHGELLRTLRESGGLAAVPAEVRRKIVEWLVLAYLGEPGGYGMGYRRPVFYSNSAAPLVTNLIIAAKDIVRDDIRAAADGPAVKKALVDKNIRRRLEEIVDLVQEAPDGT